MFEYPSMPPYKPARCAENNKHPNAMAIGPRLLLLSLTGISAAAGITACRLLLSETGDVLLLLSNKEMVNVDGILNGVDYEFGRQCSSTLMEDVGKYLMTAASSPYVRSAPLILLVLSSAAFVVGVVLVHNELRVYASKLETFVGSDLNNLFHKIQTNFRLGRENLEQRLEKTIECIDDVVADDILRSIVKTGNEFAAGIVGGYALYSLPDQILSQSSKYLSCNNDEEAPCQILNARRQLIHSLDASFDDVLFRRGGLWNIAPGLRDSLLSFTRSTAKVSSVTIADAPTVDSTANESESHEGEHNILESRRSLPRLIHVCQQPQVDSETSMAAQGNERATPRETNNLSSTPRRHVNGKSTEQNSQPDRPAQIQLEKILRRTAFAAIFCFFLHLHKSPFTRKSWRSALHFFTSCGLLSTGVGLGVASILSSNIDSSMLGPVCNNAIQGMALLSNEKVRDLLNKFRGMIKNNSKLQMALAMTVMYGIKRSNSSLRQRVRHRH